MTLFKRIFRQSINEDGAGILKVIEVQSNILKRGMQKTWYTQYVYKSINLSYGCVR